MLRPLLLTLERLASVLAEPHDGCAFVDDLTANFRLSCFNDGKGNTFKSKSAFTKHLRNQMLSARYTAVLFYAVGEFEKQFKDFDFNRKRELTDKLIELAEEPRVYSTFSKRKRTQETGTSTTGIHFLAYDSHNFVYAIYPNTMFIVSFERYHRNEIRMVCYKNEGERAKILQAFAEDPLSGLWDIKALFAVRNHTLSTLTTLIHDTIDFALNANFLERIPTVLEVCFENLQKLDQGDDRLLEDSVRHMHARGRMLGVDIRDITYISGPTDSPSTDSDDGNEVLLDVNINWDDNPHRTRELEGTKTRYRNGHHGYGPEPNAWIQISEPPTFYSADKKLLGEENENVFAPVSIRVWPYWRISSINRWLCVQISVKRMDFDELQQRYLDELQQRYLRRTHAFIED